MQVIHESVTEKAKKFVANNKGKLAALAALGALGGAGYVAYKHGAFADIADNVANTSKDFAAEQYKKQTEAAFKDNQASKEHLNEVLKNFTDFRIKQGT